MRAGGSQNKHSKNNTGAWLHMATYELAILGSCFANSYLAMYVTVSVVKNSRVFLPWTMFDASVDHNFAKLFEEVHQLDSSSAHCSTSQAATECLQV